MGFQGTDYSARGKILACAKHWVAYGAAEAGRDYNTTDMSEATLRSIYFPPFKAAVDAGVGTLMSAFNDLNGVPASANPFTLTKVLRGEWKFDGFVVSDYTSVTELKNHGVAANDGEAAAAALSAGVDMEMVGRLFNQNAAQLLKEGKISQATIDQAVRRILRVKFRLGLFEHPYADETSEAGSLLTAANREFARQVAPRGGNAGGPVVRRAIWEEQPRLLPVAGAAQDQPPVAAPGGVGSAIQDQIRLCGQGRLEVGVVAGLHEHVHAGVDRGAHVGGEVPADVVDAVVVADDEALEAHPVLEPVRQQFLVAVKSCRRPRARAAPFGTSLVHQGLSVCVLVYQYSCLL